MRSFTADMVTAMLSSTRKLDARVVIRDDRLIFSEHASGYAGDAALADNYVSHDATSAYGASLVFYRVAAKIVSDAWRIYTQRVIEANADSAWPAWILQTPQMMAYTSPGIFGINASGTAKGIVWSRNTDGYVSTYLLSETEFTEVVTTLHFPSTFKIAFAPVSQTECYVMLTDEKPATAASYIYHVKLNSDRTLNSYWSWKGLIHSETPDWHSLSAVRMAEDDEGDFCYFSVDNGKRSIFIKSSLSGEGFSNPQEIFPLDYSDDILSFKVSDASIVGPEVMFVAGTLTRSASTTPMQVYSIGPDQLTAGRDMFIGDYGAAEVIRDVGGSSCTFKAGGGCLAVSEEHIYFLLPGTVARAPIPAWVANSEANATTWTYTCNKITANFDRNGNGSLSVEVPVDIDAAIIPGMTLKLQPYIHNGTVGGWTQLGEYEIDAIVEPRSAAGKSKVLVCRPKAIKRLSQWKSDASYDYWSQAARVSDAYDQRYNVRISNFKSTDDNKLVVRDLDANALLYTAERTSSGYAARIKFQIASGRFTYVGPMVSVHAETRIDAATRLGIAPEAVNSAAVRTSGIVLMYHNDTRDDSVPGWRLYHAKSDLDWSTSGIANCPWTLLANQVDQALDDGTYEMMLVYNHGRVDSYYRDVTSSTWARPIAVYRFEKTENNEFIIPYSRSDGRARAGMFARSDLDYSIRTRILKHGYSYYNHGSVLFENPAAIEDESEVEFEEPFSYGGTMISRLYSKSGAFSTQLVSASSPIIPDASGVIYADVYPHQRIWYPNNSQPWYNTQKATIVSEDDAGSIGTRWIWLAISYANIDAAYRGTYQDLDYATSGLGIHALDGAIIEFYNSINYDGCAAVIDMVDWCPPRRWVPLWPANPYGTPWTYTYFTTTGYTWEQYPNNSSWGYWDPNQNDYNVGVHLSNHAPENIWGTTGLIRVRARDTYYDYLGAAKFPADIHFRPRGVNTNLTKARIYLPNRCSTSPVYGIFAAGWASAQRAPLMANKYVRAITTDTPVGEKIIVGSADPDRTFSWMAREICRKAGIIEVDYEKEISSYENTSTNWALSTDGTNLKLRPKTGIIRMMQPGQYGTWGEVGVMAASSGGSLGGQWNGTIITTSVDYIRKYSVVDDVVTLEESIPMTDRQSGEGVWATLSFSEDKAAVWLNDAIAAMFEITTDTRALMVTGRNVQYAVAVDWPVLDQRVDNFVLDINQPGIDLLRRLIKRKRVHFCDNGSGGIKIFRNGATINTEGTAYSMILQSTKTETDANRVTRVRLEGIDVYEVRDETNLLSYGNVFVNENFDEFENHAQFVEEGALYLEDADRSTRQRSYIGPADMRVEPWDHIWIDDGSGAKEIVVNSVTFNLLISEDQATFDMQIDGEEA